MSNIIRRQRTTWTTVDNNIINDTRLTLKALGLLVYMLSKPNDWVFHQEQLGQTWGEGREAMRAMMNKLRECGYVRREYAHDAQGRIRTITVVSELPESPTDGLPVSRLNRQSVEPTDGKPAPIVKTDLNKRLNKNPPLPPEGAAGGFDEFWNAYPKKTEEAKARRAYERIAPDAELLSRILMAVRAWAESPQWKGRTRYVPSAASWLSGERWKDELPVAITEQADGEPDDWTATRSGVEAMGERLGLGRWDEGAMGRGGEMFKQYEARVVRAAEEAGIARRHP